MRLRCGAASRTWRTWCFVVCLALAHGTQAKDPSAETDHYARCAVCHLADGSGVAGMFPPLAGHVHRFFSSPQGRGYLARLVLGGASGAIEVDGVGYAGVMPGVVADLTDGEVVDLLNGLVRRFGSPGANAPFRRLDVVKARQAAPLSGDERLALRRGILAKPGPVADTAADRRRAQRDWMLQCGGCHGADGTLSTPGMPVLRGRVSRYLAEEGGRARLVRLPGVATASLSDARLAATLNWMLATFEGEHLAQDFNAFTEDEVALLRSRPPFGVDASRADEHGTGSGDENE